MLGNKGITKRGILNINYENVSGNAKYRNGRKRAATRARQRKESKTLEWKMKDGKMGSRNRQDEET